METFHQREIDQQTVVDRAAAADVVAAAAYGDVESQRPRKRQRIGDIGGAETSRDDPRAFVHEAVVNSSGLVERRVVWLQQTAGKRRKKFGNGCRKSGRHKDLPNLFYARIGIGVQLALLLIQRSTFSRSTQSGSDAVGEHEIVEDLRMSNFAPERLLGFACGAAGSRGCRSCTPSPAPERRCNDRSRPRRASGVSVVCAARSRSPAAASTRARACRNRRRGAQREALRSRAGRAGRRPMRRGPSRRRAARCRAPNPRRIPRGRSSAGSDADSLRLERDRRLHVMAGIRLMERGRLEPGAALLVGFVRVDQVLARLAVGRRRHGLAAGRGLLEIRRVRLDDDGRAGESRPNALRQRLFRAFDRRLGILDQLVTALEAVLRIRLRPSFSSAIGSAVPEAALADLPSSRSGSSPSAPGRGGGSPSASSSTVA